jgi:transposase
MKKEIKHKAENLIEWGAQLRKAYPEQPIMVCLEQGRGPLITALSCMSWITCYPINPKSLARYREARFPSRRKNDPIDAKLLCDYLRHHHEELRPHKPMDELSCKLFRMTEHRRKLVDERTAQVNRLRAELKMYFPQVLEWFNAINTRTVWDLLLKWPSLKELKTARKDTLLKFLYAHHVRNSSLLTTWPESVKNAVCLHEDQAIIETSIMLVESICHILLSLQNAIDRYEKEIKELTQEHPDQHLFEAVPGAGVNLKPRILAAFGTDRERFERAENVQELTGIAPVVESSGNSEWTHFRWAASSFLRQTFHEQALHSLGKSIWARRYYQEALARGKSHHVAVRALAFKWIRILFACWKNNTPYDENKYIAALQKAGSPYAN